MKKFFYLLLASVFAFAFTSCSDDDDDNNGSSVVEAIVGDYQSVMSFSLKEMPGEATKSKETLSVQAAGGNKINIKLPSLKANPMMSIPSIVLTDVEVSFANGGYTFSKDVQDIVEVDGAQKEYTAKISGTINADRTFNINEEMKYGKMPLTLVLNYVPTSLAAMVANNYDTDMNVSMLEMPDDGVMLSAKPVLKMEAVGADLVNVVIPEISYEAMKMTIPSFTVENVKVVAEGENYKVAADTKMKVGEKNVECQIDGVLNANGTYKYTATIKYGAMPLHLVAVFTPQTEEQK